MKFFERYQTWLHLIGWVGFIGLPILTLPNFFWNRQDMFSIGLTQLLTNGLIIGYFYLNLHSLTPALLQPQPNSVPPFPRFLLSVFIMLLSVILVKAICFYAFPFTFMPPFQRDLRIPGSKPGLAVAPILPWPALFSSGLSFGFALLVSSLMALFRFHTRSQEIQQLMVLEKLSAELAMLKLQISPHFLFNTLNNIRWLARQKADQTEEAIVTLGQLLRYMIYQAQQNKVTLRQEVQHLQHYIDLQKMRLTPRQTVTFTCKGDIDSYEIEPLLFISFVENAFKYGLHGQQPGHIHIWLSVMNHILTFGTENPAFHTWIEKSQEAIRSDLNQNTPGIGIANVKKRLLFHYPGQHELQITNENHLFRIVLTLQLAHDKTTLSRH
ncbi:histidine kinase [Spirosoma sp. HMF3257]|uniref:Sensor protein lytS n=1 Tax=Spirosoma telluris TaxID=2183553 RepID=A0A327NL25_9BACT|nr:histidine kinase [Spirosoma telluris]RAI75455.1 sensor protein lytS [Spirosoma telluris]